MSDSLVMVVTYFMPLQWLRCDAYHPSSTEVTQMLAPTLVAILMSLIAVPAYAYLDPSVVGMVGQMLLAAIATAAALAKVFWAQPKGLFSSRAADTDDDANAEAQEQPVSSESNSDDVSQDKQTGVAGDSSDPPPSEA